MAKHVEIVIALLIVIVGDADFQCVNAVISRIRVIVCFVGKPIKLLLLLPQARWMMDMLITKITHINEYEVVTFRNKDINRQVNAYRVNELLLVGYNGFDSNHYRIYCELTGKPASPKIFDAESEAISYAEWMADTYGEYIYLLQDYPNADIVSLAQWSVNNGVEICGIINSLPVKMTKKEMECLREY